MGIDMKSDYNERKSALLVIEVYLKENLMMIG